MSAAIRIDDEPFTYEAEAAAGITLHDGERWWGTRIKWRRGTAGAWHRFTAVDVHPMDVAEVERCLRAYVVERLA